MMTLIQKERDECKRDVCCYCGGRCPQYETIPEGPNSAMNWIHKYKTDSTRSGLCVASSIYARERFLLAMHDNERRNDE